MKLLCPHCGVKGSAEDSFSGRKVKCPKCQGLFELKPEMAVELPEDSTLVAELSSTPVESPTPLGEVEIPVIADKGFGEVEVDEAKAVEEFERSVDLSGELTEPELEPTPLLQEEALDWEDIASETDLQSAEGELAEEDGAILQDAPAEISLLEDELATPDGDFGLTLEEESEIGDVSDAGLWDEVEENPAETEVPELKEESLLLDPLDSLGPEQEIENDLKEAAAIAENLKEEEPRDEVKLVEEDEDIELEPYGIDKEQCWQCGKQDSVGEPFVAKDGRLYCTDCAPIAEPEEAEGTSQNQDEVEDLITQGLSAGGSGLSAGGSGLTDDAPSESPSKFSIGVAIREAWAKTKGAKGAIWAGSAIMYLVILILVAGGAFLLPSLDSDPTNVTGLVSNILLQGVTNIFSALFTAGLLFMGVKKVAGEQISWKMVFKGFSCAGKIIVATILQFILVSIGFLLLVLPGIYLVVGYAMTLPLIVDKNLSPWQAMEMSRKAVHKIWWKAAGLGLVMLLIFLVSLIPLGIGLIWTWPMFIILAGVVYQYLFAGEGKIS